MEIPVVQSVPVFPGDVLPERDRAQAVIKRFNARHRGEQLFSLNPLGTIVLFSNRNVQEQIPPIQSMTSLCSSLEAAGTKLPSAYNRPDGTSTAPVRSTSRKARRCPRAARGSIARHPGLPQDAKIHVRRGNGRRRMAQKKAAVSVLGALVSQQHGALHRRIPNRYRCRNFEQTVRT